MGIPFLGRTVYMTGDSIHGVYACLFCVECVGVSEFVCVCVCVGYSMCVLYVTVTCVLAVCRFVQCVGVIVSVRDLHNSHITHTHTHTHTQVHAYSTLQGRHGLELRSQYALYCCYLMCSIVQR